MTNVSLVQELRALNQWAAPYLDDWEVLLSHLHAADFGSSHFVRARRKATRIRLVSVSEVLESEESLGALAKKFLSRMNLL